ncbi:MULTISPECIES: hypothetical protein [unclassified Thioalkalivibrio]|uniref:hypothetical protein n=1 Tax=unclassified Thioalkalivibrio TaxID=2621013 RepID=UPI000376F6D3|nr:MULTISPECIES: hypothetical protein [unclassified Thioalkalivibrio]
MSTYPAALPHGTLEEVHDGVFFVTGAMETRLLDADWKFSRNMTVIRDEDRLIVVNSVRLDSEGLAALEKLGRVTDVVRLGALHGRDDPFYVQQYGARYWALPEMTHETGLAADHPLDPDGALPVSDADLFTFRTTRIPEAILHLHRDGGILVACDALQNWTAPDTFFSDDSRERMREMGFFTPANIGPLWLQNAEPGAEDFDRLIERDFRHALCGHGEPLRDTAREDYAATFERIFGPASSRE